MCGIAGTHGEQSSEIDGSLNLMVHRGPDGQQVAQLQSSTLGHTRLSIVDIEGGDQPISNPDESCWLACNGEIYNHVELRTRYPDYPYKTDSDNEVILALYAEHGVDAVRYLDGMFAFAVIDSDNNILLARDHLGIKPLYYGYAGDTLHFASEIKALQDKVSEIQEFPPGHFYSKKTGFVAYYDVQQSVTGQTEQSVPVETTELIRKTLREAVRKRLMADVPVGVYLSGGLDSSILAALAAAEIPGLHSFSVGMEDSADRLHARQVAEYLGTEHHEYIYTEEEMLEALPDVIYHLESFDPALVRSAIPNYFLSKLAAQYVTVVLCGEGADELYGGYHYLKSIPHRLNDELIELTGTLYSCNLRRCDRMTMAHALEGRVPFLDTDFVKLSFAIPDEHKIYGNGEDAIEKWILRKAFENMLPREIVWRVKSQFAEGAGSHNRLETIADRKIDDATFSQEVQQIERATDHRIASKEELLYYREFRRFFAPSVTRLVKPWQGFNIN